MLQQLLRSLFPGQAQRRARLTATQWPAVIYAIGDVHGCDAELARLEALIVADAASIAGEKWIVMLGDYVDRGPRSAAVLDRLRAAPPSGFHRICLAGNHELMMLAFLAAPHTNSDWLRFGGVETLASYAIDLVAFRGAPLNVRHEILRSHIPGDHIDFMQNLPLSLALPNMMFVHAGIRPGVPIKAQSDEDLVWIREPFLTHAGPLGTRVVHGHTPVSKPEIAGSRIGIDTGAFDTGILTAARLTPDGAVSFLDTRGAQ